MIIEDIINGSDGKVINKGDVAEIHGYSIDSRTVNASNLFIPLKGENVDGHKFIRMAYEKGAKAVLVDRDINIDELQGMWVIKVDDVLESLQLLGRYYVNKYKPKIVGVTGSTGKTSTKDLIYSVLSKKYNVLKNEGNYNNHIGLPLTLLNSKADYDVLVLEMGMSNRHEIDLLAELTRPDIGVITNVGISHILNLGSREEIFNAKMEISNYFDSNNTLIVNGDDDYLSTLKKENYEYNLITCGERVIDDIELISYKDLGLDGSSFTIKLDGKTYDFRLTVPGIHNIYNSLLAIGVGRTLGVKIDDIIGGINSYGGAKMRLDVVKLDSVRIIVDCYNANPDSMNAAINVLKNTKTTRRIAILGDMLELGDFSNKSHYDIGKKCATEDIDIIITLGKESINIANGAIAAGFNKDNIKSFTDIEYASRHIDSILQDGDLLLVKGSRGMKMEKIVQYLQERR